MRLIVAGVILGASTYASPWFHYIPMGISAAKGIYDAIAGSSGGDLTPKNQNSFGQSPPASRNNIDIQNTANPNFQQNFNQQINFNLRNLGKEDVLEPDPSTSGGVPQSAGQAPLGPQDNKFPSKIGTYQIFPSHHSYDPQEPTYNTNHYSGHSQDDPNPSYSEKHQIPQQYPDGYHPQQYSNSANSPEDYNSYNPSQNSGPPHPQWDYNQQQPNSYDYQRDSSHYPNEQGPNPYEHPSDSHPRYNQGSGLKSHLGPYAHNYHRDPQSSDNRQGSGHYSNQFDRSPYQYQNDGNSHNYRQNPHPNRHQPDPNLNRYQPNPTSSNYHNDNHLSSQHDPNSQPPHPHYNHHDTGTPHSPPYSLYYPAKPTHPPKSLSHKRATGYQGPDKSILFLPGSEFDHQRAQTAGPHLVTNSGGGSPGSNLRNPQQATHHRQPSTIISHPPRHVSTSQKAYPPRPHPPGHYPNSPRVPPTFNNINFPPKTGKRGSHRARSNSGRGKRGRWS